MGRNNAVETTPSPLMIGVDAVANGHILAAIAVKGLAGSLQSEELARGWYPLDQPFMYQGIELGQDAAVNLIAAGMAP